MERNLASLPADVVFPEAHILERYHKRTIRLEKGAVVSDEDSFKAARRMVGGEAAWR